MPFKNVKKLGIIAGSGYLPKHVVDACKEKDLECIIIGLEKETSFELYDGLKVNNFKAHAISKIIKTLKSENVTHVTLAGKVKRADIARLLLDFKGAKLFAHIIKNGLNDNAILKTIIQFIESEGFEIISPEQIATQIIMQKGTITKIQPDSSALKDIKQGLKVLSGVATYDVGQALIIQNGLILGIEAAEGTDELIKRCGEIRQKQEDAPILIKIAKPEQDRRVDLPCIGPHTIESAHKFGIRGIAAAAGSALILDQKETVKLANKYKIFLTGV